MSDVIETRTTFLEPADPAAPEPGGMDVAADAVGAFVDQMWTWALAPIIVLIGLYLTVRSGFVQFRWIPEMFRTITDRSPPLTRAGSRSRSRLSRRSRSRPHPASVSATSPASGRRS